LGDSYVSSPSGNRIPSGISQTGGKKDGMLTTLNPKNAQEFPNLKPKDLVGIPWAVAFALRNDGWWLRQDIIWAKNSPMPESIRDRCTKSHEYIFLLSKSQKYFYDNEAIKEDSIDPESLEGRRVRGIRLINVLGGYGKGKADNFDKVPEGKTYLKRNKRSVWTINSKPFSEAHFACFPPELPEICIKAGTSEKGVCPDCGKAWERIISKDYIKTRPGLDFGTGKSGKDDDPNADFHNSDMSKFRMLSETQTLGWKPTCEHDKEPIPAMVLDPFAGSGTTLMVAKQLGRRYIGIELNPEYVKIAERSLISMRDSLEMKTLKDIQDGKQRTLMQTFPEASSMEAEI
jgi:DNA modification methylase